MGGAWYGPPPGKRTSSLKWPELKGTSQGNGETPELQGANHLFPDSREAKESRKDIGVKKKKDLN